MDDAKNAEYEVLPDRGYSYVMENDEPLVVYLRKNGLFCSIPLIDGENGFFLNICRPMVLDVDGNTHIVVPTIPDECDGIIFRNYGRKKAMAFYVRSDNQVMEA